LQYFGVSVKTNSSKRKFGVSLIAIDYFGEFLLYLPNFSNNWHGASWQVGRVMAE
jgi:hypothetical protein